MDQATKNKDRLMFGRVMVDIRLSQDLPNAVFFENERGVVIEQTIEYEWRLLVCTCCHGYGHTSEKCRKNKEQRWTPRKIGVQINHKEPD